MATKKVKKQSNGSSMTDESNPYNKVPKDLVKYSERPKGLEDVEMEDISIPRINVLQALSPSVIDLPEKYKKGMLVNNVTDEIIANPNSAVPIQLISFYKTRIFWIKKEMGGGQRCASSNGKIGTQGEFMNRLCAECEFSMWHGHTPPECVLYYNFPFLYYGKQNITDIDLNVDKPQLMWVSFGKTNFGAGKKLLNALQYFQEDVFNRWVFISTYETSNKKGTFFVLDSWPGDHVTEPFKQIGQEGYNFLQKMKGRVRFDEGKGGQEVDGVDATPDNAEI